MVFIRKYYTIYNTRYALGISFVCVLFENELLQLKLSLIHNYYQQMENSDNRLKTNEKIKIII